MSVWLREIFGWLLLGCGLCVFFLVYQLLLNRRIIDVIPLTFIGFVIFRGGLHLIKVATAARACRQADAPVLRPVSSTKPVKSNVIPGTRN